MEKIEQFNEEVYEMQTEAKVFNSKICVSCDKKLNNPAIFFMCGHVYHVYCVDSDGSIKQCPKCFPSKY